MNELEYEITDVGGIHHFTMTLRPGANVLRGSNGVGKTSAMRAARRTSGEPIELERRDGAQRGSVTGPGGVALAVGKVVRTTGRCEVSIADTAPLSALIDPGIADDEAAAKARLRALVEILSVGADDATVAALCPDPALRDWLAKDLADLATDDLMTAVKRVKGEAERRARLAEHQGEHLSAEAGVAADRASKLRELVGGESRLVSTPVDDARAALSAASAEYGRAVAACEQREALEAQQAEIKATLGDRPDAAPHHERAESLSRELAGADHEIEDIDRQLRALTGRIASAKAKRESLSRERTAALDAETETAQRAECWDRQQAKLVERVDGPTREQLGEIKARLVDGAEQQLERAKLSAEHREAREARLAAETEAEAATKEATRLRAFAATLPQRLGEILAAAGGEGITVVDGRLCAIDGGEVLDWARRLSDGQRVYRALDLAQARWPGQVVALDGDCWSRLDPEHRLLVHREAVARGIYLLTEEPADGALRVEHLGDAA
jgi:hypothetical protein